MKLPAAGVIAVYLVLIRTVAAIFLGLCGMRKIGFKAIFHPWRMDNNDVWWDVESDNSWFNKTKDGRSRSGWLYCLHPLIYLALFGVLTGFKLYYHKSYLTLLAVTWKYLVRIVPYILVVTWRYLARTMPHVLLVAGGIVGALALIVLVVVEVDKRIRNARVKESERRRTPEFKRSQEEQERKAYDELYELLACRPNLIPSVAAIPVERRTLRLRYLALKAKLCRPFAASC